MPASSSARKVKVRLNALVRLRQSGEHGAVIRDSKKLWETGTRPPAIRLRRQYYRLERMAKVVDERHPLPVEDRPVAARMILPRGVALRLHLTMLFAAQCRATAGHRWRNDIPIEPTASGLSWAALVAANASANSGILNAADSTNKVRQLKEAVKKLESLHLVNVPRPSPRHPITSVQLLHESAASTKAAAIPYTVPLPTEQCIELPPEFFTHGWIHALTTSEIAALLMWLDLLAFSGAQSSSGHMVTAVTGEARQGWYGLGREAYETHQPLEAFELIDVVRPEKRHYDGKWQGFNIDPNDLLCHRVALVPNTFARDAIRVVEPALKKRDAANYWGRPIGGRVTEVVWP
ncbi:hypothetical protein ACWGKU_33425 [Kitasatospora sp. NPDC054768]